MNNNEELIEKLLARQQYLRNRLDVAKPMHGDACGVQREYCAIYQKLVRLGLRQQIKAKYRYIP